MFALAEETGRRTADIDNNLNALGSTLQVPCLTGGSQFLGCGHEYWS